MTTPEGGSFVMVHEYPDVARAARATARGKVPAQGQSGCVPAPSRSRITTPAAELSTLAQRVSVEPGDRGGYLLTLTRKYVRKVWLSADEAAWLYATLGAKLPPVTVTRIEDRGAER